MTSAILVGTFASSNAEGHAVMKTVIASAVSLAALATVALAAPASAQEVEVRNAVARVVVIVEDRTDVGVEIEPGTANLPVPKVIRRGDQVRIDGDLGRNAIRNCRGGSGNGRQPGQGASVEVRQYGRVDLNAAPLIVIRTPRDVELDVSGAVFGAIGRGARSVEFGNGGCGSWTVANVAGDLDLSLGGSGSIQAGQSRDLDISLGGSGSIAAGPTGELDASLGGSGSITVARTDGPVDIAVGGSGNVTVRGGRATDLDVAIGGSGDVDFRGTAGAVSAAIAGSGDIRVANATGPVSRATPGSGRVIVGP